MELKSTESLDKQFFVVLDELGKLSPIDPESCDNSNHENWIPDELSDKCLMCHSEFNSMVRRRHHCRSCGLLLCGQCVSNRLSVNDAVTKVCDACSAILVPATQSTKYTVLQKWAEENEMKEAFDESPKNVAFKYLISLMKSEVKETHSNALRLFFKLFPTEAPSLIQNGVPAELLNHALTCDCGGAALSLDLFISLYNSDPEGCEIDFGEEPFNEATFEHFYPSEDPILKIAATRLLLLLVSHQKGNLPNLKEYLSTESPWENAFLLASLAHVRPEPDFKSIQFQEDVGEALPCDDIELIPTLLAQFDSKTANATVASKYFAAIVLERMSHYGENIDKICQTDLEQMINTLFSVCPKGKTDERPETHLSILLGVVLLNIWKRLSTKTEGDHAILFSQVLMPIFEVLGIPNRNREDNMLTAIQTIFVEMVRWIAANPNFITSLKSEQMTSLLEAFAQGDDNMGREASKTLDVLK